MKKVLFLAIFIILLCSGCKGITDATDGLMYKLKEDGTYEVQGLNDEYISKDSIFVSIPNTYLDKKVTSISCFASQDSNLEILNISENIYEIGTEPYNDDITPMPQLGTKILYIESLQEINVSDNNNIYASVDGVLFNKDKTRLILYPEGRRENSYTVIDSVTKIGTLAFSNSKLEEIVLPANVKEIEYNAFYNSQKLNKINLPDSLEILAGGAFNECNHLKEVRIPPKVNKINYATFFNCASLEKLYIHKNVEEIHWFALNQVNKDLIIYCEDESHQPGWDNNWSYNREIIWNYKYK